jgi:hypothetical protein
VYNKITFSGLLFDDADVKSGWNFGMQQPDIPNNVKYNKYLNCYIMEDTVLYMNMSAFNAKLFHWYNADGTVLSADNYTQDGNLVTFTAVAIGKDIYCEMENDDYYNLEKQTVLFRIQYSYDPNDVMRMRNFLNQTSMSGNTNGKVINPN